MNESPTPAGQLDAAVRQIRKNLSADWFPSFSYYGSPKVDVLSSAQIIVGEMPDLTNLCAAIIRQEVILLNEPVPIQVVQSLPDFPQTIMDFPLIDEFNFKLFDHDTGHKYIHFLDVLGLKKMDLLQLLAPLNQSMGIFTVLSQRYLKYCKDKDPSIAHAYARLMKEYIARSILPKISTAIDLELPVTKYELYEMRNALAELANLNPAMFAETVPLRTFLMDFIEKNKFKDKNTQKPVVVKFADDCPDPLVYIDPGALGRMTRNLLRDAVTHGDGPTITPIIQIIERDGYVEYVILSPGHLDERTLSVIGLEPYTTQDQGQVRHGFGKVGARKLLTALWRALGINSEDIKSLFRNHWSNVNTQGLPYVQWKARLPVVN